MSRQVNFLVFAFLFSARVFSDALSTESANAISVNVKEHLVFSNAKDPVDKSLPPTTLFLHEVTLSTEYREYAAVIQFANRYTPDGKKNINKPLVLEKKAISAGGEEWELHLGDSHHEFGRGIALSLYRDPVFGIDNTLEGISTKYHSASLAAPFEASLLAGRVNSLVAPVAIHPVPQNLKGRTVWLTAGSVSVKPGFDIKLGGHYVLAMSQPDGADFFDKRWHTAGATLSHGFGGNVEFYGEQNLLFSQRLRQGTFQSYPNGYGGYGSVVWSSVPWKIKWEFKDYRNYDFEFRRAPTLEEEIVETLNTENVTASRLYVERRVGQMNATMFGSYLVGEDRGIHSTVHHGVVGSKLKLDGRSALEMKTGYRLLPGHNDMIHASGKIGFPTFHGQSLDLNARKVYSRANISTGMLEDRTILELTYSFSDNFNATLGYEYMPFNAFAVGKHFPNLGAMAKAGDLTGRAFVGQTSGGTRCSGGVCRQVPPYTGAMVETTVSF